MTEQLTLEQEQILHQDWVKNIKYVPLYDYSKVFHYDQEKGTHLTGTAVFSQTLSKILIIDVDNKVPYEQAQENFEQLKRMFVPENTSDVYIEQTGNLGLHIFLYNDLFDETYLKQVDQCRFCELFKKQYHNFDIDIFTPSTSSPKKSIVDVAKPHCDGLRYYGGNDCRIILDRSGKKTTRVKDVKSNVVSLKIISVCQNFIFTKLRVSEYLEQILTKTGIDIKLAFVKRFDEAKIKESHLKHKKQNIIQKSEEQEQDQTQIQNESLQNCISLISVLLTGAEIHNFSGTNIKQEITLLPLFRSIMVLPKEEQQKIIEEIYNVSNLTPNAKKNYFSTWERVKNTQLPFNDLGIFFKMIKYNCPKRYKDLENEIKKVQDIYALKSNNGLEKIMTMNNQIDFSEPIIFEQVFQKKYIKDNYFTPEDWFLDVQKVLYYNIKQHCYYKKTKMDFGENNYYLEEISIQNIQDILQKFKIGETILVDYLQREEIRMYIEYRRVVLSLNDDTKNEFPIFRSFPYIGEQHDELLQLYFEHIREIICRNDEIMFKYILDLFAFYIQNPISQSGVVLVITGPQGNGKNSLTTPLLKLMGAYGKEVNDINHVLGQFNPILEATHLLVCDEMVQCDYTTKKANFDRMKTLITSPQILINQKSEKPRFVGNMLNFIFLSNHNRPVIIEDTNRRYCVIKTAPKKESDYYDCLYNSFEQKGFYEALMHFLQTRDISEFRPQKDMPITQETMDIIQMSLSPIEQFVYGLQLSHFTGRVLYANFKKFMQEFYPNGQIMNYNNFSVELHQYYEEKRINNKRIRVLKEEFKQESRKMDIDFDVVTSEYSNNI